MLSGTRTTPYNKSYKSLEFTKPSYRKNLKLFEKKKISLKQALQIVSKDLYHNSFVMQPDNIRVDTEYQDAQHFVLVGTKEEDR